MKLCKVDVPNREIGAAFGGAGGDEQAKLISFCGSALYIDCGRDQYRFELQLHAICDELDADGDKLITELAECIKLRDAETA